MFDQTIPGYFPYLYVLWCEKGGGHKFAKVTHTTLGEMGTNLSLSQSLSSLETSTTTTERTLGATAQTDGNNHYPGNSESLNFLFIPLAVLITVMLLSVMVYLMSRRKHKIFAKHPYVPSFTFETSDIEDDDDMETEHLLKGKLRLDEPYFKGINSSKTYSTNGTELYA